MTVTTYRQALAGAALLLAGSIGWVSSAAAETWERIGRESFAAGDQQGAERSFREALAVNPFDPVALNNLAVVKADRGNYSEAQELLERAHQLDPANADIEANLFRLRTWLFSYAGSEPPQPRDLEAAQRRLPRGIPPAPPAPWSDTVGYRQPAVPVQREHQPTHRIR